MLLLLLGNRGLWGPQYRQFQWLRRQETLGARKKIFLIPDGERLLRKNASFEFHQVLKNCGSGALLFVSQTLIVSMAVSWWREGLGKGRGQHHDPVPMSQNPSPGPLARLTPHASSGVHSKQLGLGRRPWGPGFCFLGKFSGLGSAFSQGQAHASA